jgi:hypothetical protein
MEKYLQSICGYFAIKKSKTPVNKEIQEYTRHMRSTNNVIYRHKRKTKEFLFINLHSL